MFLRVKENITIHKLPEMSLIYDYNNILNSYKINKIGVEIILMCNGENTLYDIINEFYKKYNDNYKTIQVTITNFINNLKNINFIECLQYKSKYLLNAYGSFYCYSPISLAIEITKKCPLKCAHCYTNASPSNNISLEYDDIIKILDEANEIGIENIMFTGGEVFEYKQFMNIIKNYNNKFKDISIATTGYYINENIAKQLSLYKNLTIRISLDGNKNVHNSIRNNKNAFDRAINAIKILNTYNLKLHTVMTISRLNINEIENTLKIAKLLGKQLFEYGFVLTLGRAKNDIGLTTKEIIKVNNLFKNLKNKYEDKNFKILCRGEDATQKMREMNQKNCGAGHSQLGILANGDYSPCFSLNFKMGNINNMNLKDLLKTNKFKFMQQVDSPKKSICKECENLSACEGCMARALDINKNCDLVKNFIKGEHII